MDCLDKSKFQVFSDLLGQEAAWGGTMPPEVCVTPLKPDIVIIETHKKKLNVFFLAFLSCRTKYLQNKYAHICTDIDTLLH